jgi:hypothetical protein
MLEELQRNLCVKENVLSLAITFNNNTAYTTLSDTWMKVVQPPLSYQLSIIARFASNFFQATFSNIELRITNNLDKLDQNNVLLRALDGYLIRLFFQYIVELARSYKTVNTLILIVDEAAKLKVNFTLDCHIMIRKAILDVRIIKDLNAALIMSSLYPDAFGNTKSERGFESIIMDDALNEKDVVSKWWLNNVDINNPLLQSKNLKSQLVLLSEIMNHNPRICEYTDKYLKKIIDRCELKFELSSKQLKDLMENINQAMKSKIGSSPSIEILYAVIFNKEIKVNQEVIELVSDSFITNHLKSFNDGDSFFPMSSMIMLSFCFLQEVNKTNGRTRKTILSKFCNDRCIEITNSITQYKKKGDCLQKFLIN